MVASSGLVPDQVERGEPTEACPDGVPISGLTGNLVTHSPAVSRAFAGLNVEARLEELGRNRLQCLGAVEVVGVPVADEVDVGAEVFQGIGRGHDGAAVLSQRCW